MAGWTSPLDFIDQQDWPTPQPPQQPQSNWLMAGAKAGLHDMASFAGGTGQWLGKLTGIEPLERAGQALSDSQSEAANAERPDLNIAPWREGGASVLPWLGYQAVRNLPYIAATGIASRFIPSGMVPASLERAGAYVPEMLGGGGARVGQVAGEAAKAAGTEFARNVTAGAIAGAPMAIGSMQQEVNERVKEGGDPYTWGEAATIGLKAAPYSALESLGPAQAFGIAKQIKSAKTIGDVGKIALKGMGAGAIEEMPQEAIQTAMEQAHRTDLSVSDKAQNIIDGALTGAAVGGVFGGVAGGVSGTRSIARTPAPAADTASLEASTREVDPEAAAAAAEPMEPELPMDMPLAEPPASSVPLAPEAAPTTVSGEEEPELPGMPPKAPPPPSMHDYLLGASGISAAQASRRSFFDKLYKTTEEITPEYVENYAQSFTGKGHTLSNLQQAASTGMIGIVGKQGFTEDAIKAQIASDQATIKRLEAQMEANPGLKTNKKKAADLAKAQKSLEDYEASLGKMKTAQAEWQRVKDAFNAQKGTTNGLPSETSGADAGPDDASSPLGQEVSVPAEGRQGQQSPAVEGQGEGPSVRQGQSGVKEASVERSVLPADAWGNGVKPTTVLDMFPETRSSVTDPALKDIAGETATAADLSRMYPKTATGELKAADPLAGKSEKFKKLAEQSKAFQEATEKGKTFPLIEDQYETPEFKNWFGQSKATDESGAPLRVYTGTSKDVDFSKFRAPKNGVWFSENPNEASQYAVENDSQNFKYEDGGFKRTNTAPRVIPAHLSMQNPMVVEDLPAEMQGEDYRKAQGQYFAKLKSQGYDGLIMGKPGNRAYVVFKPEQIKSSVSNKGTFSTTDGNISKLVAGEEQMTSQDHALADHIRNKASAAEVFDAIANDTARPEYKKLAQSLKRLGVNPKIEFAQPSGHVDPFIRQGESLKGEYQQAGNSIKIYKGDNLHRTVLHEAVHAATVRAIQINTRAAKEVTQLLETARKALGYTGTQRTQINPEEFVAEAYTNPAFRDQLRSIYPTGSKMSVWDKFKNLVAKWLRLPTSAKSLLDEVMDAGDRLMEDNAKFDPANKEHLEIGKSYPLIEEDKKVAEGVSLARRTVDGLWNTLDPKGFMGLRLTAQRMLLKASSWGHIAEHFGHLWKGDGVENALQDFALAHKFHHTTKAHLGDLFRSANAAWSTAPKAVKERIGRLAWMSSLSINPLKKPEEHTWLKPEELTKLTDRIKEANRIVKELKDMGGLDAYQDAIAYNEIQEFAVAAMRLHWQMETNELYSDLLGKFKKSPMQEFNEQAGLHNNIREANDFWRNAMDERYEAIKEKNEAVDELIGKEKKAMKREGRKKMGDEFEKMLKHQENMGHLFSKVGKVKITSDQYPYFHLMRDGDSFVAFKLKSSKVDGKIVIDPEALKKVQKEFEDLNVSITAEQGQDQVFMRFPTEYDSMKAHEAALRLQAADLIDKDATPTHGYRTDAPPDYILSNAQLDQAVHMIQKSFKAPDGATDEVKQILRDASRHTVDEFRNYIVDMMPEGSLAKVNVHRENKPGFSLDMEKAFARRAHIGVNALASMAASTDISRASMKMKDGLTKAKPGPQIYVMQNIYREAMLRERDGGRIAATDGNLIDVGRAVNSFWHLALSPSYALINSAQIGVLLWPELAKSMGYAKAAKSIMKVMPEAARILKEAFKAGYAPGSFDSLSKFGHATLRASDAGVTQKVLEKAYGGKLGAREEEILNAALRGNIDLNSAARELARISEGLTDNSADALFRVGASFGQYSETFTRLVAALAAHDTYDEDVAKRSGKKTVADYIDYVVDQSMLNYAEDNTARGIGRNGWAGPLSPLMFSFMNYQMQVLEKLYREFNGAVGLRKDFTAQQKKDARRFLLGHAVALTALTGTLGLPAAGMLAGVVNRLKEAFGDDKDIRENYREWLADVFGKDMGEVIAHGLPTALGVSVSKRAGEQDIIPFSGIMASRQKFMDATKDWAFSMGGAPLNAIANLVQGAHDVAEGNYTEGLRKALPVFAKGPIAAYQMSQNGYVDTKGSKIPMTADEWDIMVQLLGFIPAEKAEYQEQRQFMADRKGLEMARGTNIRKNLLSALEKGDQETAQQWMTEANALAQVSPERDIRPSIPSSMRRRANERAMAEAYHTPLGLAPKRGGMTGPDYANWRLGD